MTTETAPELPYMLLRAAQALFGKAPDELDETQRSRALQQAQREQALETRILCAQESAAVIVPEEQLERALATIRARYPDDAAFQEDLARNALDLESLRYALQRQCKVENVMEKIAADAPTATETDIALFYHAHLHRFHVPETRDAFHILITIPDDGGVAQRDTAWEQIHNLALQLAKKPYRLAELAQRHSECPTALQGGHIGPVTRGHLYPELDEVLFQLRENEIGGPVESPIGFHLVKCGTIRRAHTVSLRDATPKIRRHLNERLKEHQQKRWIAGLSDSKPMPTNAP